ncbi:MAG TPA: ABC transporter permease [Puia sp.]|nr:ABC transporter permease [Puia sp.]
MFKSYFKTAYRFLVKNKTYSFINIFGLAAGTLCCIYIVLYVEDQYNYDKHHKRAQDIYRITTWLNLTGDQHTNATSSPPIAPAMKNDFAEVEQFTRVIPTISVQQHLLRYKEKSFYEKDAVFVDSTFFDVFSFHFTNGSEKNALSEPNTLVLLKPIADKLFGHEDPLGKVIEIDNAYGKRNFKVTAVVDESLGKSHIHANLFMTMNSGGIGEYVRMNTIWAGNNFANSYVKLYPKADVVALEKKLPAFLNKYGAQQLKELGMKKVLHLQPVTVIHTSTGYQIEMGSPVNPNFLYILLLIAALIQIIACINFMNLSTARASKRAKEVGVRKVVGARKRDLIRQFLSESFLLSLLSVAIALPLLVLAIPYFNIITQADIHLTLLSNYRVWTILAGIVIITGLVAGSYPAFYLSAFQAIKVIKGNFSNQVSAAGIRRSLVIFQFVLSIMLITGIVIIYSQLNYIKNKDIGFDKNQRLIFSIYTEDARKKMDGFMSDLRLMGEVKTVSKSNNYLSQFVFNDHGVYLEGGNMANAIDVQNMTTDEYFVKANGIKLLSGRDFGRFDSTKVLINETLARRLGLKIDQAPGTKLYTQYLPDPASYVEVVGVMKDFNFNSLHDEVKPFMLLYDPNGTYLTRMTVAASTRDFKGLLAKIEKVWHNDLPGVPFEYAFLNDEVQKQYETEIILSNIINSFTLVAILISCLGLFGLATFSAEQRSKEIGIRKVLGANVSGIVQLLSKDFLKLVIIAFVIATPLAWWAMHKWLQAFAYKIPISWWMFALSGALALFIAFATVSSQAIKAALANPVKNLRTE